MKAKRLKRNASRIYLYLIPFLVVILGFGIGKISYTVYLPVWIFNVVLMIMASRVIGLNVIKLNPENRNLIIGAFFLIVPMVLISMFFGLGPPPDTPKEWVETATEQQVRYSMLAVTGLFIAFGFALIREKLKEKGENLYSLIGFIAIMIAIPLFILDMLFWGFTLTESFKILISTNSEKLPEWFKPIRVLFGMISVLEVALTYLATSVFAVSLKLTGLTGKISSKVYVVISIIAFLIILISNFLPEPFITAGFIVSIPAIPFIMPYYIGVNLLHREGEKYS